MKQEGRGGGSLITEGQLKLEGHLSHPHPAWRVTYHTQSHTPHKVTYHTPHPAAAAVQALLLNCTFLYSDHSSRPLCWTRGSPLHFIPVALSAHFFAFHFFLQNTAFFFHSHFLLISMPRTDLKRNNTSHIFYSFLPHFLSKRYILLHKL